MFISKKPILRFTTSGGSKNTYSLLKLLNLYKLSGVSKNNYPNFISINNLNSNKKNNEVVLLNLNLNSKDYKVIKSLKFLVDNKILFDIY